MNVDLFPEVAPYQGNPDPNQRYTIRRARDWCKRVAGVTEWDLDAAACLEAHHAPVWYGLDHPAVTHRNGLAAPWFGDTFNNPPWDDIYPWCLKGWKVWNREAELERERLSLPTLLTVSMLLPGDRTHRDWWRDLVEQLRDGRDRQPERRAELRVHFAPERFPYGGPGNPEGIGAAEPNFTSVLLVWRPIELAPTPESISAVPDEQIRF